MNASPEPTSTSGVTILARLFCGSKMPLAVARQVLTLGFNTDDQARMCELADRNQWGTISAEENTELINYVRVSHLLALIHAHARKVLRPKKKAAPHW